MSTTAAAQSAKHAPQPIYRSRTSSTTEATGRRRKAAAWDDRSMLHVDPISPRTRHLLMVAAEMLPDQGREDIDQDDPARWLLFDRYPRITHGRDAGWRRRALRASGDLAAIINNGQLPRPG